MTLFSTHCTRFSQHSAQSSVLMASNWRINLVHLDSCGLWQFDWSNQWPGYSQCNNIRTDSHLQLYHRLQPCGRQYSHLSSYSRVVWEYTYLSKYVTKGQSHFFHMCIYKSNKANVHIQKLTLAMPELQAMVCMTTMVGGVSAQQGLLRASWAMHVASRAKPSPCIPTT